MNTRSAIVLLSASLLFSGAAFAQPAGAASSAATVSLADVATRRAGSLVTLKFNLSMGQGEREMEASGVMIEKDGLILASNFPFGGLASRFGDMAPVAKDIKVLIGEDTVGVDATLIARDTELGLAWLKIKEPKGEYSFVDFGQGSGPALGDNLYVVSLLGKFFDRAPSVTQGTVSSITSKPRKIYIPSLNLADTEFGMPVFDGKGNPVGVITMILPDKDEAPTPDKIAPLLGNVSRMIIPAADVLEATKNAKLAAASAPAETPAPATEPAKDAPASTEPGSTPK